MRITTHMSRFEIAATRPGTFLRVIGRTIASIGDVDDYIVSFELEPIPTQPPDDAEKRELWGNKADEEGAA